MCWERFPLPSREKRSPSLTLGPLQLIWIHLGRLRRWGRWQGLAILGNLRCQSQTLRGAAQWAPSQAGSPRAAQDHRSGLRSGLRSRLLLAGQVACEMENGERWEQGGRWLQRAR